jgi:hypothetical protein
MMATSARSLRVFDGKHDENSHQSHHAKDK